jgi:nicotinate-nucleotide pyrophosphorylase (carboxylating)
MSGHRNITFEPCVRAAIRRALEEDIGPGDATTLALVAPDAVITASVLSRVACVVAGCDVAAYVFAELDSTIRVEVCISDGGHAAPGDTLVKLSGHARGILTGERTALNFMQRMSGIATLTSRFVEKTKRWGVSILDTRKTTPGLRLLEKYAVTCGGGLNHRIGLYDRILIKDNHRRFWSGHGRMQLDQAIAESRRRFPSLEVEVEVESDDELINALAGKPDWVLLDNMLPVDLARCAKICDGRAKIEASGGITLNNVEEVARTGVNAISLGCLTHSAPAVDLSLEIL